MRGLLILLPMLLILAACGGDTSEPEESGNVIQTFRISETEFELDPSTISIERPGTYEFEVTNDGQITHALEIEEGEGGAEAETGNIEPGDTKTIRFTFGEDGSYEMYCPIGNHRREGMDGTITVGSSAAGAPTTTDEDEDETETETDRTTTTGY